MEKNILVGFTINEAQVLLEIIDIAVRARGIDAAEAGLVLTKKIQTKLRDILPAPATAPEPPKDASFAPHIIKP